MPTVIDAYFAFVVVGPVNSIPSLLLSQSNDDPWPFLKRGFTHRPIRTCDVQPDRSTLPQPSHRVFGVEGPTGIF
jgi:hypothetical protein